MVDLDELERLERSATGGRWTTEPTQTLTGPRRLLDVVRLSDDDPVRDGGGAKQDICEAAFANDAALIVAARNALPELIARVREAEGRLKAVEAKINAAIDKWNARATKAAEHGESLELHDTSVSVDTLSEFRTDLGFAPEGER